MEHIWFILIFLSFYYGVTNGSLDEVELVKKLLDPKTYNNQILPQNSDGSPLNVSFGILFNHLQEINGKEGYMKSMITYRMKWTDRRLRVNGGQSRENISVLRLSHSTLWKPSIVLANAFDTQPKLNDDRIFVYPDTGSVLWIPKTLAKTSCILDTYYFPFDEQTCVFKFSSSIHTADELALSFYSNKHNVDVENYEKSETWAFVETKAFKNRMQAEDSKLDAMSEHLSFDVTFRRKAGTYYLRFLLPVTIVSLLSILTFALPTESDEKLIVSLVSVVILFVVLIDLGGELPLSALGMPLITQYLLFLLIINIFTILGTTLILHLIRKESDVPECTKNCILTKLGNLLKMTPAPAPENHDKSGIENNIKEGAEDDECQSEAEKTILSTLNQKKIQNEKNDCWKTVASILDRTFFLLFTIISLLGIAIYSTRIKTLGFTSGNENEAIQRYLNKI